MTSRPIKTESGFVALDKRFSQESEAKEFARTAGIASIAKYKQTKKYIYVIVPEQLAEYIEHEYRYIFCPICKNALLVPRVPTLPWEEHICVNCMVRFYPYKQTGSLKEEFHYGAYS